MRLIDTEELDVIPWTATGRAEYDEGYEDGVRMMADRIDSAPTVDAAPVVHGRWVSKSEEGIYGPTYCSICDFELRIDDMPYCPMCGAKMDKQEGERDE